MTLEIKYDDIVYFECEERSLEELIKELNKPGDFIRIGHRIFKKSRIILIT